MWRLQRRSSPRPPHSTGQFGTASPASLRIRWLSTIWSLLRCRAAGDGVADLLRDLRGEEGPHLLAERGVLGGQLQLHGTPGESHAARAVRRGRRVPRGDARRSSPPSSRRRSATPSLRGGELTKEQIVESQRILNEPGSRSRTGPSSGAAADWIALRRHLWHEEMQRAACRPARLQRLDDRPGDRAVRQQEQKERFLPATANLDIWWSQGFSEPDAGSDLASLRTTAVRDGDDWVVNGQKTWTTLGQYGDWIFTLVRTDPEVKKQAGISMLLIDMTLPGVEVRPIELIDGGHEVNEVWFTDVRVPGEPARRRAQRWLDDRQVPARQRARRRRPGRERPSGRSRRQGQRRRPARRPARPRPASPSSRTSCSPSSSPRCGSSRTPPTASRTRRRRCSSSRAPSSSRRSASSPSTSPDRRRSPPAPDDDSPLAGWARRSAPTYLNLRKASIYGGSNEIQRQIIARTILGL